VAKRGNSDVEGENNFILEDLQKILNNIQLSTMGTDSEEDFDHLFEDMDLNSTKLGKSPEARNEIIAKVLSHLDKIDFKLEQTELDVLGDAYEYLIGQFASGAGIKEVSNFYGQEMNRTTYNLARMNMILHGVHYRKFDIKQEDTLEHPQHNGKQFEAIVANPPFSANWSANPLFTSDDRFSQYGRLAPASKADWAFVQHMIHHLAENGTMAIVLPHGALFRSGAEQHIRKYLIEDRNYLDAVIGLPEKIFFGTDIPTCILVFKKCRETPNDVVFIDASQHYGKATQNYIRQEDMDKIISTYQNRVTETKYSFVATLAQIEENDYNLNIPRYVDTFEEEEEINLVSVSKKLVDLEKNIKSTESEIAKFCNELNISTPF
jgi:type I restriction enzyme M protein